MGRSKLTDPLPRVPLMALVRQLLLLSLLGFPFQNAHGLGFDIVFSKATAQRIELGNNAGLTVLLLAQRFDRLLQLIPAVDLPLVFALEIFIVML